MGNSSGVCECFKSKDLAQNLTRSSFNIQNQIQKSEQTVLLGKSNEVVVQNKYNSPNKGINIEKSNNKNNQME